MKVKFYKINVKNKTATLILNNDVFVSSTNNTISNILSSDLISLKKLKIIENILENVITENIIKENEFIYCKELQGKSNNIVFYTSDFKYAIKTITVKEYKVFLKNFNLNNDNNVNVNNIITNINTYIPNIIKSGFINNYHFIIMQNIFKRIPEEVFDLKGSESHDIFNANIDNIININIFKNDINFLSNLNLMDYSLVIGLTGKDAFLGICDIFTEYSFLKRIERIMNFILCRKGSSIDPESYKKRILKCILSK